MPKLIPIKYGKKEYPINIKPKIQEIAAHFDIKKISPVMNYSMHTEYSYMERKNAHMQNKKGIPQLWFDEQWVLDFIEFIKNLVANNNPPAIIEVHPPFEDYSDINKFLEVYQVFEKEILKLYPGVKIVIENRSGTKYNLGKFIISTLDEINELIAKIKAKNLNLEVVLDLPQLFTAHGMTFEKFNKEEIAKLLRGLSNSIGKIGGIHIWGKRKSESGRIIAHCGTLDTYFGNKKLKGIFMKELYNLLDDNKERFFLPEVNSSVEDLQSIVKDFIDAKFTFI